jgi:hypothetical protein
MQTVVIGVKEVERGRREGKHTGCRRHHENTCGGGNGLYSTALMSIHWL